MQKKYVIITCFNRLSVDVRILLKTSKKMSLENCKNRNVLYVDRVSWELSEGDHLGLSHVLCLNCCSDKGIHQGGGRQVSDWI